MLGIAQRVSLLGDGEGYHLQRRLFENFRNLFAVVQHGQGIRHRADNFFIQSAVRVQRHADGQIVIRTEAFCDDLIVVALTADDTGIHLALLDQALAQRRREDTENIARTEVQPLRILLGVFGNHCRIVTRKVIALPCLFILNGFQ